MDAIAIAQADAGQRHLKRLFSTSVLAGHQIGRGAPMRDDHHMDGISLVGSVSRAWSAFWALVLLLVPIFFGALCLVKAGAPNGVACVVSFLGWGACLAWLERQDGGHTRIGQVYAKMAHALAIDLVV